MSIIGRTTINPFAFYSGKIAGYLLWAMGVIVFFGKIKTGTAGIEYLVNASYVFLFVGSLFTAVSLFNLGSATRLGIPDEKTVLKTGGIYRFSRNPMYVGFNFFTIAAMLFLQNVFVTMAGLYCIGVYHFIILGEERFLKNRFKSAYLKYAKKVRRYI